MKRNLLIVCWLTFAVCVNVYALDTVDINTAGIEELADRLKGIGPAKASAIVKHRTDHGPFQSVDELIDVKGIGPRTLEKLRQFIRAGPQAGASAYQGRPAADASVSATGDTTRRGLYDFRSPDPKIDHEMLRRNQSSESLSAEELQEQERITRLKIRRIIDRVKAEGK